MTVEPSNERNVSTAKALAIFTIVYNLAEGAVAMGFGAHDNTLSLFGFGMDSLLESASGAVVLWQLSGLTEEREKLAEKTIGGLLMTLAFGLTAPKLKLPGPSTAKSCFWTPFAPRAACGFLQYSSPEPRPLSCSGGRFSTRLFRSEWPG